MSTQATSPMSIKQLLQQATEMLSRSSDSARIDAQAILCHVLDCNSAYLMTWPEKTPDPEQLKQFEQLLAKRARGIPVAYLTGEREFWSLPFYVNEHVLIPRPETETLVEFILQHFADSTTLKVLDMGTGSGAIAISLAHEKPGWQLSACDISEQALAMAAKNNRRHNTGVNLVHSNWFANITEKDFDIIVSNPPYIDPDDPHLQQGDVRFEPDAALSAANNGMADIELLCRQAPGYLKEKGLLVVEHGYNQQQAVAECFASAGFEDITQHQDLSGHTRITAGKLKA